jgi:hypothetical protein
MARRIIFNALYAACVIWITIALLPTRSGAQQWFPCEGGTYTVGELVNPGNCFFTLTCEETYNCESDVCKGYSEQDSDRDYICLSNLNYCILPEYCSQYPACRNEPCRDAPEPGAK